MVILPLPEGHSPFCARLAASGALFGHRDPADREGEGAIHYAESRASIASCEHHRQVRVYIHHERPSCKCAPAALLGWLLRSREVRGESPSAGAGRLGTVARALVIGLSAVAVKPWRRRIHTSAALPICCSYCFRCHSFMHVC